MIQVMPQPKLPSPYIPFRKVTDYIRLLGKQLTIELLPGHILTGRATSIKDTVQQKEPLVPCCTSVEEGFRHPSLHSVQSVDTLRLGNLRPKSPFLFCLQSF